MVIELSEQKVRINHKASAAIETSGHMRYENIFIQAVGPGLEKELIKTWLYDIDLDSGQLYGTTDNADNTKQEDAKDEISAWCDVGKIGELTANAALNDTVINVNPAAPPSTPAVVDTIDVGDFLKIGAVATIYEVISKDKTNNQLTLGAGLSQAASATDDVIMLRYFIGTPSDPIAMGNVGGRKKWGDDTFDSARIPVGKELHIKFKNSHSTKTKDVYGVLAIIY